MTDGRRGNRKEAPKQIACAESPRVAREGGGGGHGAETVLSQKKAETVKAAAL